MFHCPAAFKHAILPACALILAGTFPMPVQASAQISGTAYMICNGGIMCFTLAADGGLKNQRFIPMPTACLLTVSSTGRKLYVVEKKYHRFFNQSTVHSQLDVMSRILTFSIGKDGSLSATGTKTELNRDIGQLVADPKSRYLFAYSNGGKVVSYGIGRQGSLSRLTTSTITDGTFDELDDDTGQTIAGAASDGSMTIAPDGKYAFLTHTDAFVGHSETDTMAYLIGNKGSLQEKDLVQFDRNSGLHKALPETSPMMKMRRRADTALMHVGPWLDFERPDPEVNRIAGVDGYRRLVYSYLTAVITDRRFATPIYRTVINLIVSHVDKDGKLTSGFHIDDIKSTQPAQMFLSPHGDYLYGITTDKTSTIHTFAVGKDGTLRYRSSLVLNKSVGGVVVWAAK